MLNQELTLQTVQEKSNTLTCSQCVEFHRGVCRLKAAADWGDSAFVKPFRPICAFASLKPF